MKLGERRQAAVGDYRATLLNSALDQAAQQAVAAGTGIQRSGRNAEDQNSDSVRPELLAAPR
jgi:hypothetical protein